MKKHITLVMEYETDEQLQKIRAIAAEPTCIAWSMDHEILRNDLIEKAINENDIKKAEEYLHFDGVAKLRGDLAENA